MTNDDRILLSCYEQIAMLNEAHGVALVQHRTSKNIYVKKTLSVYNPAVLLFLKKHPVKGIPKIEELIQDGSSLIVIEEYISGRTIQSVLDDGNLFPKDRAIKILLQLCDILSVLHHCEPVIVHRDIKPSNIILTPAGEVRLIDMNAAKQFHPGKEEDTSLIGTNGYAAPEQYGFGASGVQADIYAAGVLLNEMILGVSPRKSLPEGELGELIRKCTMIDPESRYPSAAALAEALQRCLGKAGLTADPADYGRSPAASRSSIPGFRSGNPSHIIVAIIGYLMIFYVGLTLAIADAQTPASMVLGRIIFIISCIFAVYFTCNYKNIWNRLHINRIRNTFLKTLAVAAVDALLTFIMIILMILVESFL